MPQKPDLAALWALLEPVVEAQEVELYDLEFLTEYGRRVLRLYIEKDGGINLDDCEKVNYAVEPVLDAYDPIPDSYILEVSSPGIERKLIKDRHFEENLGKWVEVKLNKPVSEYGNRKKFQGELMGFSEDYVQIDVPSNKADESPQNLRLPREHMTYCRLRIR